MKDIKGGIGIEEGEKEKGKEKKEDVVELLRTSSSEEEKAYDATKAEEKRRSAIFDARS